MARKSDRWLGAIQGRSQHEPNVRRRATRRAASSPPVGRACRNLRLPLPRTVHRRRRRAQANLHPKHRRAPAVHPTPSFGSTRESNERRLVRTPVSYDFPVAGWGRSAKDPTLGGAVASRRKLASATRYEGRVSGSATDRAGHDRPGNEGEAMAGNPKAFEKSKQGSRDEDKLLRQYGVGSTRFAGTPDSLYERHLKFDNVVEPEASDSRERFEAAARSIRDILADRWLRTDETYARENPKRVYYVSIEFLIGRSLGNNVMNLMLDPVVERTFDEHLHDWWEILHEEPDAGLGNGGLGRLAACFLDSMATMQLPAMGYGLRYEHGIFRQRMRNGWQEERPDNWLRHPDPWEVVRPSESVEVTFGCSFELRDGTLRIIPRQPSTLIGVPFDRPVIGYGGQTVNTLRLWSAAATHSFDFQRFSGGDFVASIAEALNAESLTRVLYPDDHTLEGRGLRLMQEYFLVACSVADIVRRFRERNEDWETLPEKAAIQLNDTHPALAVPELMRILLDEAHLDWDDAWDIAQRTLAYTNHTLLPEALERWPVKWLQAAVPRQLEIIFEINRRLVDHVHTRFPGDRGRAARVSLVEEGEAKFIRMANLAIVGSHSTNGVAAIHSELLRATTVRDLAETFPDRFNNKTNGVTPRRWLKLANPPLAETITAGIGDSWVTDLGQLQKLRPLADDAAFRAEFRKAKRAAKARLTDWLNAHLG